MKKNNALATHTLTGRIHCMFCDKLTADHVLEYKRNGHIGACCASCFANVFEGFEDCPELSLWAIVG